MLTGSGLLDWLNMQAGLPNMVFFSEINDFIDDELINEYLPNLGRRVIRVLGGLGLTVLTLWIILQGYRIVTGQSRESMLALMVNSLRATFIVGIALGVAVGWGSIYTTLTNGLVTTVSDTMTGDPDSDGPYSEIDRTLAIMQVALEVTDAVDTNSDMTAEEDKDQVQTYIMTGLGLPAIVTACALLLNKIAIGLVTALGPFFILCLLWDPLKPLFQKWLFFGIGTLFSMALLTVTATLALDMVIAVGMSFWVSSMFVSVSDSAESMAMQQGGLGLIMTTLIVSAPPMAAMLFQGTLGQFSPYSAFSTPQPGAQGQPGYPIYTPPSPAANAGASQAASNVSPTRGFG